MPSMAAAFSSYEILHPHALLDSSSTSFFSVQMGRRAANAASSSPLMTAGYSCSPEAAFPEIIPAASEMMSHDSCSSFESGTKLSSGGDNRGVLLHSPRGVAPDQLHHESEAAGAPVKQTTAVKKRKCYRPSVRPASSIPVNNPKDSRKRRQKRSGGVVKGGEEEEMESPKPSSPPQQEPDLSGYIHVRARRGQATDSHSLAERVRREKISERMKLLQGLVPGCDKVTGKALMLDEIINYVQSLQNQVEFLSMKLASLNPIMYDFGLDLDEYSIVQPQKLEGMSPQMPSTLQPVCHIQPTEATTNYAIVDNSVPFLVHDLQGPSTVFSQGNGDFVMQEGDNGSLHHHQHQFNVCSFQ